MNAEWIKYNLKIIAASKPEAGSRPFMNQNLTQPISINKKVPCSDLHIMTLYICSDGIFLYLGSWTIASSFT